MNLDVSEWKEFRVGDLFDIHPTKAIEDVSAYDCVGYGVPLVVNQSYNNGIAGLCDCPPSEKGGVITFSDTWEGNTFFYQPDDFIGFAHVQGMYPKNGKMSGECLLFIATILEFEAQGRYSYGRKKRRDIIMEVKIKLPVDKDGNPDWKFMEDYIRSLHHKPLTTGNNEGLELKVSSWKEFRVGDYFDIHPTKAIGGVAADDCAGYGAPLVVNSAEDNGVAGLCDLAPTEKGGIITFSDTTDGNTFSTSRMTSSGLPMCRGCTPKTKK